MQVNYAAIPTEMRQYRQWVCWRYEDRNSPKPTKVPYDPRNGHLASVTDPNSWCDFDMAVAYAQIPNSPYDGIGFVLTKFDPYTFIDLDDTQGDTVSLERQQKIFKEFDSYSERSPSGQGLHIIVKGNIPAGRRRSHIEVYSSERYMTMTGDIFHDKPIEERQSLTHMLWAQMGGGAGENVYHKGDAPETETDEQVITRALAAVNGDKFKTLLDGQWQGIYPSQSEADFAFIDIIAFYTQSKVQIARIFRRSILGQRDKAQRGDYVDKMILRAFDRMLPPIDIIALNNKFEEAKADGVLPTISGVTPPPAPDAAAAEEKPANISGGTAIRKFWQPMPIVPPPGLVGDIAKFIYNAAPRPVPEAAIVAAIGLMAGICGRSYNVSGTGLNQYILLLAPTGTGKEGIASGISKLMDSVKVTVPACRHFRGPAEIASGQALLKHISNPDKRCFVSIVGEFGLKMQQLASPRASASELTLKRVLLDLYNKSGFKDTVAASIYAQKENNTEEVESPSVTILGESTPETFYDSLDERLITDGLLPRFMFVEYTGKRPPRNIGHELVQPDPDLILRLKELTEYNIMMQGNSSTPRRVINVGCTADALTFLNTIDKLVDDAINETNTDTLRHLWNRAHIKTLKLAALVAVGRNYNNPIITIEDAEWALNVIMQDIVGIVTRFSRGEIGRNTDENKQGREILRVCVEYAACEFREVKGYGVDAALHKDRIIPNSFISRKLRNSSIFRNDRNGAREALNRTIKGLLDAGDLREVGKHVMDKNYSYGGRAFMLAAPDKLAAAMD